MSDKLAMVEILLTTPEDEIPDLLALCDNDTKRLYREACALVYVRMRVDDWIRARTELRAIEQREHPDITDHYGRLWVWRSGDLYTHDATLCMPLDFITSTEHPIGLPSMILADNPNYAQLCTTCRQNW